MGWHIQVRHNSLHMSRRAAVAAAAAYNEIHGSDVVADQIRTRSGKAIFPYDWLEWGDWVGWKEVVECLCRHGVKGRVVFRDNGDGVWKGCVWSYDFDGKGGCVDDDGRDRSRKVYKETVDPVLAREPVADNGGVGR